MSLLEALELGRITPDEYDRLEKEEKEKEDWAEMNAYQNQEGEWIV